MDDIIRPVDFEFEVAERAAGTGLTLEGYAAVFNTPTFIDSWEGRFEEVILPGSFRATLERSTPKLMFEHGKHPLIGNMPLGTIDHAAEDSRGVHIKASLSDNWLVQPVRDAIRDKAVTGMSFRMVSASIVDQWEKRASGVDLRSISALDCPELGPVVFPAYEPTTVAVRSVLDRLILPEGARTDPDGVVERAADEEPETEISTGQPVARSAGDGDATPGNERAAAEQEDPNSPLAIRHRMLRLKGILA